jgi:hypothetical protein
MDQLRLVEVKGLPVLSEVMDRLQGANQRETSKFADDNSPRTLACAKRCFSAFTVVQVERSTTVNAENAEKSK